MAAGGSPASAAVLRFGGFALDLGRGLLLDTAGSEVPLRPKTLLLLRVLAENAGRTLSKDALLDAVWGDIHVTEDSLFQCVREARRALGDAEGHLLRHLPRRGYLLEAAVEGGAAPGPALPDRSSLAVLPFTNLGGEPADGYVADGLAEELITALSRVRALFVVARGSSFAFRGPDVDVRRVGRELGVRYVLEGGVRRAGGRLRVTCRLAEAATGAQIWAERFEGEATEVFALQDRVAQGVAAAAEPRVMAAEVARAARKGTADLSAYDLYLRALPHYWSLTERGKAAAVALLRRAVALDPRYGRAVATLAHCLQLQTTLGWPTDVPDPADEALRLSRQALAADRDDALVLAIAGNLSAMLAGEHEEAQALARRALVATSEDSALVWTATGWTSAVSGESEEAIRRFRAAMRLDPLAPYAGQMRSGTAVAHFFARRFAEAERWSRRAVAASPEYATHWRYLVASLALQGREAEARQAAADAEREMRRCGTVGPLRQVGRRRLRYPWMSELLAEGLERAGISE